MKMRSSGFVASIVALYFPKYYYERFAGEESGFLSTSLTH